MIEQLRGGTTTLITVFKALPFFLHPLHMLMASALILDNSQLVKWLIERHNYNIHQKDSLYGHSLAFTAFRFKAIKSLKTLLEKGVCIESREKNSLLSCDDTDPVHSGMKKLLGEYDVVKGGDCAIKLGRRRTPVRGPLAPSDTRTDRSDRRLTDFLRNNS